MSLPSLLKDIADKYLDGRSDAFWQHKQSGQWLIKHRDLEIAATKANIFFDPPTILEAKAGESVAMVVSGIRIIKNDNGTEVDRLMEWSIGEASPKNTTQSYPYAMAEKRAKDRVILKLFGAHGHAYSEEEADDFKEKPPKVSRGTREFTPEQLEKAAVKHAEALVSLMPDDISFKSTYLKENADTIARCEKYPKAQAILAEAGLV